VSNPPSLRRRTCSLRKCAASLKLLKSIGPHHRYDGHARLIYRWWFGAHGVKMFEANVLRFIGAGRANASCLAAATSSG
jgi:hypothetical protein